MDDFAVMREIIELAREPHLAEVMAEELRKLGYEVIPPRSSEPSSHSEDIASDT